LHVHVVLVVIDVENGFGSLHDLPHDYGGDFGGVAILVVDLELAAFEVADTERYPAPPGEQVGPPESPLLDGSIGGAEEQHDLGFVRVRHGQTGEAKAEDGDPERKEQRTANALLWGLGDQRGDAGPD